MTPAGGPHGGIADLQASQSCASLLEPQSQPVLLVDSSRLTDWLAQQRAGENMSFKSAESLLCTAH